MYLHREEVDHRAVLGHTLTADGEAAIRKALDEPRVRVVTRSKKVDGEQVSWEEEEAYTTRELDLTRYRKSKKFRDAEALQDAPEDDEDDEPIAPLPPVEIPSHPIDADSFAPRSGIKQVINLVAKTDGWERHRLTHSRGPYVGSKGECLSISDFVVLGARQVLLDGTVRVAVASWRDGKFDFAYIGIIKDHRLNPHRVDATSMKNWIKGTYDLPDPLQ
jgi:hypothetical protein